MSRTTLDIDRCILDEIRRIQRKERRSMGKIVSQLLADALSRRNKRLDRPQLRWVSQPMQGLIDLSDKDALYSVLDTDRR